MALSKSPYRGTRDFFPEQMRLRNYIFKKMAEVSELFAYEPYDGPILEEVDLYFAKSGEELINEQIYSFVDRGDRRVAIRPEMTPTVARMAAQVHREIAKPIRWYAIPNLMRYEKPQRGRLREFWQYNADIFGADELGDIEIIQLAVDILKSFGATHQHFEILINDRRVVDLIFKKLFKLDDVSSQKLYKIVDKNKKVTEEALVKMTAEVISDPATATLFSQYLQLTSFSDLQAYLEKNGLAADAAQFLAFSKRLEQFGLNVYVRFDPSIVRGLDYYTGVVFEIFDKHPDNRRAIAGGGAYANLLQIFNESPLAGVGFGLGEVPLTEFLKSHNLVKDFSRPEIDVLISYQVPEGEPVALTLAEQMRSRKIKVEVAFGETKSKKVFSLSEKKNFRNVILIGEDEMKNREVQIKTLETRETQNVELQDMEKIARILKGLN
ncbi:MAG TPA: histidine--tRNA ligase [Bacteriovoracaceae bacterium]|nr:histidine--tRNA ligase [Bacteriovoracaceae bacterium]